ncbi:MAG: fibronectin type III domain-containing protein [Lachnospiraceae bacterium]|nr:fibronectin type III domain-containing protein [Lachnospiraceae bacterium]
MKQQLSKKEHFILLIQKITIFLLLMIITEILFQSIAEAAEKSKPKEGEKFTVVETEYYGKDNAGNSVHATGNPSSSSQKNKAINSIKARLAATVYSYNGVPRTPAVIITDNGKTLKKGTDYTVSYKDNINAGTAKVIIKGKGIYTGTVTRTFTIKPKAVSGIKIRLAATTYSYNGTSKTPAVKITHNKNTLKKDTDYTISYKNNKEIGTATVTITGKGNYTGMRTLTFKINPARVTSFKQSAVYSTSTIKMSWKKVSGAAGYVVYRGTSKGGTYKLLKTVTTNSCSNAGLKAGSKYYYKVRAYKTVNGKKVYGDYSESIGMSTKPAAPANLSLAAEGTKVKISWTRAQGPAGYEVYMSASRDTGYKTIQTVNPSVNGIVKNGFEKGKKYYFKIRAYATLADGTKIYSGYSSVKSITIEKPIEIEWETEEEEEEGLTAKGLLNYCKNAVKNNVQYVYGCKMEILTASKYQMLRNMYGPSMVMNMDKAKIGKMCCDCSGLISSYTGILRNSAHYYDLATERATISQLKANWQKYVGWAIWMRGHIGIVSDTEGYYYAMDGSARNAAHLPIEMWDWKCVIKLSDIKYGSGEFTVKQNPTVNPVKSDINVYYQVYANSKWYGEVKNYSNTVSSGGFAGVEGKPVHCIMARLSRGKIKSRVHITGGDWSDWVDGYDSSDPYNGYAGKGNKEIDGVQFCLEGLEDYDVYYRVSTTASTDYLPWVRNAEDYAGVYGRQIDKVQICISKK